MLLLTRLILVLSLLLQPMQGLTAQRCVGLLAAAAPRGSAATNCCCVPGSGVNAACPLAGRQYAGCNCVELQREKPAPPPEERKGDHSRQPLAFSTATVVLRALTAPTCVMARGPVRPPLGRSGRSMQQVLCTWLI